MAFDKDLIAGYVSENEFDLIAKTILETDLAAYTNVRVGLKGDVVKIPLLGGDFNPANGLECGFTPSADTTDLTQVTMELANKKYNQTYCPQVLRDTFLSQSLAAGAMGANESISFEVLLADYYVKNLKKWNEYFLINGDGAIPGYKTLITTGGAAVQTTVTPAAWTSSNAIAQAQSLVEALPAAVANASDLIMVVSPSALRSLRLNITQANYYHIAPSEDVIVPGTTVKVVATSGLESSDFAFIGRSSMMIMGTDLTSDFEQFSLKYSEDNDEMRAIMRWRVGVAVSEANLFAHNGLA